MKCEVQIS